MSGNEAWIFLDLDGTLTDAAPGITRSIAYALEQMGHQSPPLHDLEQHVGAALRETFPLLGVKDFETALAYYRERYTDLGLFENARYQGLTEMMDALRNSGFHLAMATAKPLVYAKRITEHFDLAARMNREFGSELDGGLTDKEDLLRHALKETGADPRRCFMLGDRSYDAIGARRNGITPIGALWGYGSRSELEKAGCAAFAAAPDEVAALVETLM